MHVDLLGYLRCPRSHGDSALVASAVRTTERRIIDGTLGCPVCAMEFPVREGVVWFGVEEPAVPVIATMVNVADEALRLAAQLALGDGGGLHLLVGTWGALAGALTAVEHVHLMLVSPPAGVAGWSTLRGVGDTLPLAEGALRGVAIDQARAALANAAAKTLAPNGRLVAPVGTPVPGLVTVLARDDRHWVGSRKPDAVSGTLVMPRRAIPRTGLR